jgi:hypothetical protein
MSQRRTWNNRYTEQYIHEDETGDVLGSYHVTYDVTPFIPETGPSYACAGEPASGREIEIVSIVPEPPPELESVIKEYLQDNHDYSED